MHSDGGGNSAFEMERSLFISVSALYMQLNYKASRWKSQDERESRMFNYIFMASVNF